jgi:tetratricopeptide (TPR) repeat protein
MEIEHPVRRAIEDYRSSSIPSERLDKLLLAFELLIRVDALLLAGDFLRMEECRDDKVRELLLSRRFQLGEWYSLLQTLVSVIPGGALSELKDWFIRLEKGPVRGVLQGILRLRNPRAHNENRTTQEFVTEALRDAEDLFDRCLSERPDFGSIREGDGGRLLLERTGNTISGGPFLLSGSLAGHPGTVLIYRGSSANRLSYASLSGVEYWSGEIYREVVDILRMKISPLEIIDATIAPDILHERVLDSSRQALHRLIEMKRYRPEITVDRAEVDTALRAFIQGDSLLLMVDGPPGAGKTTCLCQAVEERIAVSETVLLESADHLPEMPLPDAFGSLLRVRGEVSKALERLAISSSDGRVLIALDDVGMDGREEEELLSLFHWIERLPSASPLRIIATIRSDLLQRFLSKHEGGLSSRLLRHFRMPPLSSYELMELAEKLPVPRGADSGAVISIRREVAGKMGEIADGSARRPGLAVAILESSDSGSVPSGFSAALVYEEIFRREILENPTGGAPKRPRRVRLVRRIAEVLLRRASLKVPIDDDDLIPAHLLDAATGERSMDYEALLSSGVLVETVEEYVSYVSFADLGLLEFVAALSLPAEGLTAILPELCRQAQGFPPALSVAAHLLLRVISSSGATYAFPVIEGLDQRQKPLLVEIASLNGSLFLKVFELLARSTPSEALLLVKTLIHIGEPRLAGRAAEVLIASESQQPNHIAEARFLRASALYEIDNYSVAEEELARIVDEKAPHLLILSAEIAVARGEFKKARAAYESLVENASCDDPVDRAQILRGLGDVLGRLGHKNDAEARLRAAIKLIEEGGDSKPLAEAWADLGQLLGRLGRFLEARQCFEKSLAINQRIGLLVGIGVVNSLIGELGAREGKWDQAEHHLQEALDISRRVGNLWREAWTLKRLSGVSRALGRSVESARLRAQSRKLCRAAGILRQ